MAADLHTEGLEYLLKATFSEEQAVPANYYIGLATDASLAEAAALTDITEVAGTGYARIAVASDNVDFTGAGAGTADYKITTKTVQFTGGAGGWTGAQTVFLCDVISGTVGKLIASAPLSATRTLAENDTLDVAMAIQLNG